MLVDEWHIDIQLNCSICNIERNMPTKLEWGNGVKCIAFRSRWFNFCSVIISIEAFFCFIRTAVMIGRFFFVRFYRNKIWRENWFFSTFAIGKFHQHNPISKSLVIVFALSCHIIHILFVNFRSRQDWKTMEFEVLLTLVSIICHCIWATWQQAKKYIHIFEDHFVVPHGFAIDRMWMNAQKIFEYIFFSAFCVEQNIIGFTLYALQLGWHFQCYFAFSYRFRWYFDSEHF